MTGDGPVRLRELFLAARGLDPAEREAYLSEACPDPKLRADVLALLDAEPIPDRDLGAILGAEVDLRPPQERFGRFTLIRSLGAGGMGRVDLAFDPRSQREVAIKRLHADWVVSPELVERFEREIMATSKLEAAGLCPVYEVGEVDGAPYFTMPVVQGESLDERIRRGTRKPTATDIQWFVRVFEKVARAIHRAHEAGLVHRDIKPGNIMIQPDGEPVVLDFGLAQDQEHVDTRLTRTGQLPGTPSYMAPEQVAGSRSDYRTDVYALGISLYECVCGERPFVADSRIELFDLIRSRPLPSPRRRNRAVSRDLAAVLEVATEKEPAKRYRAASELADDLERVCRHRPVLARRIPAWARLGQWCGRNRLAAAVVGVLALGFAGSWLLQHQRDSLNESLRQTINAEKTAQATANELRSAAQVRLDDFHGLAAVHRTRQALEEAPRLVPAWPDKTAALGAWLDRYEPRMRADVVRLTETLERMQRRGEKALESRAEGSSAEAELRRELEELDVRIAFLRSQNLVRLGQAPQPSTELPADAPESAEQLIATAWSWVDPERPLEDYGNEHLAYAYLKHALQVVDDGQLRHEGLHAMLWALVATGADLSSGFPREIVEPLVAPPPPGASSRYRHAVLRADDARRNAREQEQKAMARRTEIVSRLERPWLAGLSASERSLELTLRRALAELREHLGPGGLVELMRYRREWAASIEELTRAHPNARVTWQEAAAAIAAADGETASAAYAGAGIELEPILGLVPIGMNPVTRLWEFYHLRSAIDPRSGSDPRRLVIPQHAPDGSLELPENAGIVFVLLPGGLAVLGSQRHDPADENYDPQAMQKDQLVEVELAPFLVARHETTQGQWMRLELADNPSFRPVGYAGQYPITSRHPVENVSHERAQRVLADHGLRLPSHWEWEYACRAGTTTPWFCGDQEADLRGYANVGDLTLARHGAHGPIAPFSDGHVLHAPVGEFAPNAFGLYDVHGNVAEHCTDEGHPSEVWRPTCGGSYLQGCSEARASARVGGNKGSPSYTVGVRTSRSLL